MRRSIMCCASAAFMLAAVPSYAQSLDGLQGFYAGGAIGTATFFDQGDIEYDYLGYVIAGQAGYRLTPDLRVEAELAYEATEGEIGSVNVDLDFFRLGASAYYDFNTVSVGGLLPFAGGGVGIVDGDGGRTGVGGTEPSVHLDGGASMRLGDNLDIVPMARWELIDDASNVQLRVGARFWF